MTEEKIIEILNRWTPVCHYSKEEFEKMTREEAELFNKWETRLWKRFWKFVELVAMGEADY